MADIICPYCEETMMQHDPGVDKACDYWSESYSCTCGCEVEVTFGVQEATVTEPPEGQEIKDIEVQFN